MFLKPMISKFFKKSSNFNKIFGIGLSRTGTTSLNLALIKLGLRSLHFPVDDKVTLQLTNKDYKLDILKKNDALTDIITVPFYKQFDKNYPNSKFIMTIRDKNKWLESMEDHWKKIRDENFSMQPPLAQMIVLKVWGRSKWDRNHVASVYDKHVEDVLEYFKNRNDLLILDICGGEGWEKLCKFLSVDIISMPFPYANRKAPRQAGGD